MEEPEPGSSKSVGLAINRKDIRQTSQCDLHSLVGLEAYNVDELERGLFFTNL